MNNIKRELLWGIGGGLGRGLLMYIMMELLTSSMVGAPNPGTLLIPAVFGGLSVLLFCFCAKFARKRTGRVYILFLIFYAVSCLCIFENYLSWHIFLFPRREMWYGDAISIIFSLSLYFVIAGLGCLIACIAYMFVNKASRIARQDELAPAQVKQG